MSNRAVNGLSALKSDIRNIILNEEKDLLYIEDPSLTLRMTIDTYYITSKNY